jgi:hypothetical protein
MKRPIGITILSIMFLFAMSSSMAQGAVAGAQIEFIADEANFVNGDWKSIGVAGKKLKGGKKLGRDTPVFAHSFRETDSTFNGSIHLVRVYDRVLNTDEIAENLSVEPANKLTTTWGRVKTQY